MLLYNDYIFILVHGIRSDSGVFTGEKEFGNLHIQNAKTESAGQADTEHILGDEQAQGFITPDDILGLLNLDF